MAVEVARVDMATSNLDVPIQLSNAFIEEHGVRSKSSSFKLNVYSGVIDEERYLSTNSRHQEGFDRIIRSTG